MWTYICAPTSGNLKSLCHQIFVLGTRSLDWVATVWPKRFGLPIVGLGMHSLEWGPTVWELTVLVPTVWGLHSGAYMVWATNFVFGEPLTGLMPTVWCLQSGGSHLGA